MRFVYHRLYQKNHEKEMDLSLLSRLSWVVNRFNATAGISEV
jgi:hypothetical protein